jgi:hypothetical protein
MSNDIRNLLIRMADELDHYWQLLSDDRREVHPLAVEARAALAAEPVGEVGELVAELREKFEQLIKCSRAYDGYSTMTPVELADRLIDAVLKLEADR